MLAQKIEGIIKIQKGDSGTLVIAGKRVSVKIVSEGETELDKIKYVVSVQQKTLNH